MRGKGYCRGSANPVLGITPAYAGKSDKAGIVRKNR